MRAEYWCTNHLRALVHKNMKHTSPVTMLAEVNRGVPCYAAAGEVAKLTTKIIPKLIINEHAQ